MNKERVFSDRLNLLDSKLDKILELLTADKQPGERVQEAVDPLALLNIMKEWGAVGADREKPGMHEETDRQMVLDIFEQAGVAFDPRDAWCGAGLRAALILAGFEDPGERCHKASNYETYGEPCERQPGAIWVGYAHVAVVSEKDGYIWGCNQSNRVCEQHERYYGEPICFRMPV